MSNILNEKQSEIFTNFLPYIDKTYLNEHLNNFKNLIFGDDNSSTTSLMQNPDDKLDILLKKFNFDVRTVYSDREFIAINYLHILSQDSTTIENAKLRYIIYYCACYNAASTKYKIFQFNNNFYITISSSSEKSALDRYLNQRQLSINTTDIKDLRTLKLPSHFEYYIEKIKYYARAKAINPQPRGFRDPTDYFNDMPIIVKLDMNHMFSPIINDTFNKLINQIKNNKQTITLLLCEYIITQYIKKNYTKHINYNYTANAQVQSTVSSTATQTIREISTNLNNLGNKIRELMTEKIKLPDTYTQAMSTKIINDNIIDMYLRSEFNFIKIEVINILKNEGKTEDFILDLHKILYHRSSELYLKPRFTITDRSDEYIFVNKNIIIKDSIYNTMGNLNQGSSEKISDIANNQVKKDSLDPYYSSLSFYVNLNTQRESLYSIINEDIIESNKYMNLSNEYTIRNNVNKGQTRKITYKAPVISSLEKDNNAVLDSLLIILIRNLQITDILKKEHDVNNKIAVLNIYFKLGFDDYDLYKKSDKLRNSLMRCRVVEYCVTNIGLEYVMGITGIDASLDEYGEIQLGGNTATTPEQLLSNDLGIKACNNVYSHLGSSYTLTCTAFVDHAAKKNLRFFKTAFERETSLLYS